MKKRDILLSLLSGILLILSFPNFDLEFLAWVALVPLLYSIEGKGAFHSFELGFLTGLISFLGILYWIIVAVHTYGNIPLILSGLILLLLVVYLSLFIGAFTFFTRLIQIRSGLQTILFAPLLWVALEYPRSFLLTGFPWANLGYSQYLNLPFIQMADITGTYGLSFVIVLVNATLFYVLRQWSTLRLSVLKAGTGSGLTLSGNSSPRGQKRGSVPSNGSKRTFPLRRLSSPSSFFLVS